ncbi:MAG: hypothetical protein M1826_003407 [Phylliscum demangeonii]|nr:MAG: hypothetical protein M1826_003407 [Phylliscum demangeonii]
MGRLSSLSPGHRMALGVLVGLISTGVQSLGLTLQRKSHMLEESRAAHQHLTRRPAHRRRRWQVGMLMFIVANILGSSIQITTLPLPVLSTLQASGLVFNSLLATLVLHETFSRYSLAGTVFVCAGAMLIGIFGATKEAAHTVEELVELLHQRAFVLWMAFQAVLATLILVVIRLLPRRSRQQKVAPSSSTSTARHRLGPGLAYGCVSGLLSAHTLLLAKSAVELVVRTVVDGRNQFRHPAAWLIVLAMLGLALTQLYFLHRGLALCSTSLLYPLVFCVYNITAILDGLIYFRQLERLTALEAGLITLGTAILLSGVFCLSYRLDHDAAAAATASFPPPASSSSSPSSPAFSSSSPFAARPKPAPAPAHRQPPPPSSSRPRSGAANNHDHDPVHGRRLLDDDDDSEDNDDDDDDDDEAAGIWDELDEVDSQNSGGRRVPPRLGPDETTALLSSSAGSHVDGGGGGARPAAVVDEVAHRRIKWKWRWRSDG